MLTNIVRTLLYHSKFQSTEINNLTFQNPSEKFGLSSNQEGLAFPRLPFVQAQYGHSMAKTHPVGLSNGLAICPAQSTNTKVTLCASISKQPQPSLTEHMEMQHNWGRFNPNTKPPVQAKGNEDSDREIFPRILSDQPSVMQSDLTCHQSQADRGQWGWGSTEREQNDLLEWSLSRALACPSPGWPCAGALHGQLSFSLASSHRDAKDPMYKEIIHERERLKRDFSHSLRTEVFQC